MFCRILNLVEQGKQYNEQQCAKIFNELFSIIKKIHKQGKIVHNDLKHENFLLKSADPESPIVIADFGMAEPLPPDNTYKELKGSRNGTWGYMAPELLERSVHSVKTDIWALGVALYIALNASLPFDPKKVQRDGAVEIMKGIPRLNLDDPNRIGISADAADLLKNLFRFNPYKRFDADKALAHPFLSKWREQNSNDLSSLLPELRKFRARQKFRVSSVSACFGFICGFYACLLLFVPGCMSRCSGWFTYEPLWKPQVSRQRKGGQLSSYAVWEDSRVFRQTFLFIPHP